MLRVAALIGFLSTAVLAAAQVAAPEAWRKESFTFPLQFAPSIPYEGAEHVRFAPYWAQFAEERGFTYVFLWDIRRPVLQPAELERALNVYFDGLMEMVTKARKVADPGTVTSVALHPLAPPSGWSDAASGRLWTWNGFSTGEPLVLHAEVTQRTCSEGRTQVFFAFSRAARTSGPWDELRDIRRATTC